MMDILKKKTPKTEKRNLKHVKQIFKSNSTNQESNKTKNNEKAKKKKTDIKKNTKASEKKKKKVAQKIASSGSSSSKTLSNVDKDSDSINDISENKEVTPRLRNRGITKDKTRDDDQCNVGKKKYSESTEDWFQCKIFTKWAYETCGVKGVFNFFCSLCH